MFNRFLILFVALALPGLAMAMWSREHSIPTESDRFAFAASSEGRTAIPGLFVPNQIIDLGSLAPTGMDDASFKFENKSDKPINIVDVSPQCGCTAVTMGQQSIAPGTIALVSVRLDATRAGGSPFRKGILATVNCADGTNYAHLYLTGTIDSSKQFVVFNDTVDVGEVVAGTEIHRKLLFRGSSTSLVALPAEIPVILGDDSNVPVARGSGSANLATRSIDLVISVPPDAPISTMSTVSTIAIVPTGLATSQKQSVRIIGRVSHPVHIEPNEVLLQRNSIESASARIELRDVNQHPFSIARVSSDLPLDFLFSRDKAASNSIIITAHSWRDDGFGEVGHLKIEFNGSLKDVTVPVFLNSKILDSTRPAVGTAGVETLN